VHQKREIRIHICYFWTLNTHKFNIAEIFILFSTFIILILWIVKKCLTTFFFNYNKKLVVFLWWDKENYFQSVDGRVLKKIIWNKKKLIVTHLLQMYLTCVYWPLDVFDKFKRMSNSKKTYLCSSLFIFHFFLFWVLKNRKYSQVFWIKNFI